MADISISDLQGLIKEYAQIRAQKEELEEQAKAIEAQAKGLKGKITSLLMENQQSSFRVDGVGLVSVVAHERVPTPKSSLDRRQLWDYIKEKYGEEVCYSKFAIHDKTLTSFFKEERAMLSPEDQELFRLPGVGEPTVHHDISFRVDKPD